MKVIKVVLNGWKNDSRDKRELSVYQELGAETLVVAKGGSRDYGREDCVDGFRVRRLTTRPVPCFPLSLNRILSLFYWAHYTRNLQADVISGHDLGGLAIGWMSNWFSRKKAALIYDSHEFEIGRNAKRTAVQKWFVAHLERFLMNRCVFSIMVNDSIADEVQRIHHLKERPIVVRSTPERWVIQKEDCETVRKQFLESGGWRTDETACEQPFLVSYHGGLTTERGIETVIKLTAVNPHVRAVIIGDGDEAYVRTLKTLAREINVEDRILFHPAVPLHELWKYVGAVDLSLILLSGKPKSYYLSLPNKFFESIQSLTPLVTADFPELKRLIDYYQIGLTCDPDDLNAVNTCVEKMRTDKDFYARCKENIGKAKEDLCWEKEKQVLIDACKQYLR